MLVQTTKVKNNSTYIKLAFPQLVILIIMSFLVAASEVMIAISMKRALELLLANERSDLIKLILMIIGIIVFAGIGYYFMVLSGALFKKRVLYCLKQDYADAVMNMSLKEFTNHSTGNISSSITNDVNKLETQYLDILIKMTKQLISFILASVTLIYFSPLLVFSLYIFIFIIMFAPRKTHQQMGLLGQNYSTTMAEYSTKVQELLGGFELIKALNAKEKIGIELQYLNQESEDARYNIGAKEARIISLLTVLSLMSFYVPFLIGSVFVLLGRIEIGVLIAVVNLSGSIINPIQQFGSNMATLQVGNGIFSNVLKIINMNISVNDKENLVNLCKFRDETHMKNVSFTYSDKKVLSQLNLNIKKGSKNLILGHSGSGKSTILKLLMGLYDDYEGSITIDGTELRNINKESLSQVFTYIPQETFIFNKSLKENIIFNKTEDNERLRKVCQESALDECIERLSNGIDTVLGDGAQNLSGGEKQRIGIARALYQNVEVLLVDEPTAALDDYNSKKIFSILLSSLQTVICVTHKVSEEQQNQFDHVFQLNTDNR